MSDSLEVISEVPQGTVVRLLILQLVIDNIDFNLKKMANANLFADDTRLAASVSGEADVAMFQQK